MAGIKKIHPLLFVPGTIFWLFVILGAVTGDTNYFGYAMAIFVFFGSIAVFYKVKAASANKAERLRIWNDCARSLRDHQRQTSAHLTMSAKLCTLYPRPRRWVRETHLGVTKRSGLANSLLSRGSRIHNPASARL